MIKGKTIFLTGGAGFIGTKLIERLEKHNKIIVFDSLKRNSIQHSQALHSSNVKVIQGDILDMASLEKAMAGVEIVVHLAAVAGIDTVILSPTTTMRVNTLGTSNVLEVAKKQGNIERFIDFSTSEVFGQRAFKSEEKDYTVMGAVGEARWTYAVSKLAAEHLSHAYYKEFGLPTVVLRPFNIYGPGQVGEGAVHAFINKAIENKDLEIHGDGTQIRAWCYVDDMIDGILCCIENPAAVGESFNIGNSRAVVTIYGLANAVIRACGSQSKIKFIRKDYVDVELRVPSVQKAKALLDFESKVDLEEGLRRTAEYYRKLKGLVG